MKKQTLSKVKKKTWDIFSIFIRKRDCLRTTGSLEYGECITCDFHGHISQLQAGHFVSRRYNSTFFDERNAHAQCPRCNGLKQGEQYIHGQEIDKLYGKGTADELMSKRNEIKKFTKIELQTLGEIYKDKIKQLTA